MNVGLAEIGVIQKITEKRRLWMLWRWVETEDDRERMNMKTIVKD